MHETFTINPNIPPITYQNDMVIAQRINAICSLLPDEYLWIDVLESPSWKTLNAEFKGGVLPRSVRSAHDAMIMKARKLPAEIKLGDLRTLTTEEMIRPHQTKRVALVILHGVHLIREPLQA